MKMLLVIILAAIILVACGKSVDVKEMYKVDSEQDAQQATKNVEMTTTEKYDESKLKKIIIDASSQYNHDVVNGIRFKILQDGKQYAQAKIAFNKTGMNATGTKKENIAEITIK